jgi:hypothetical protein
VAGIADAVTVQKLCNKRDRILIFYSVIWFIFAGVGVYVGKQFYAHYFLTLLPPLCLVNASVIINIFRSNLLTKLTKAIFSILLLLLALFFALNSFYIPFRRTLVDIYNRYLVGRENWGDNYAMIANYLRLRIRSMKDYIYVVDSQPIIYYLSEARIPTRYAFPYFLVSDLNQITGIDALKEFDSIFLKNPLYVIVKEKPEISRSNESFYEKLNAILLSEYQLETTMKSHKIYRRKLKPQG